MTILVTGGKGRIGRYIVKQLLDKGERVRILTRDARFNDEITKELCEGADLFIGDVRKMRSVTMALSGVDMVFHFAAILDPYANKREIYAVNVNGARNIFSACLEKGADVLFLSSIAAMGDVPLNADENTPCKPTNAYGKSKYEAEMIMDAYIRKGLKGSIIRPGDVYGVGFREGYETVLKLLKEKRFAIPGDGNNHVPLVHVEDLTDAVLRAWEKMDNEKYIIAGPQKTLNQIIATACEVLDVEVPKKHMPIWLAKSFAWIKKFEADLFSFEPKITPYYIDILTKDRLFNTKKAEEKLNFKPKKELKKGIKEVVEWLNI